MSRSPVYGATSPRNLGPASVLIALVWVLICAAPAWADAGFKKVKPERAGFDAARLERVGQVITTYVDAKQMAGASIAIARDGQLVYDRNFGLADAASATPVNDDTLFRIYSMTKPVTSLGVMMLFEEGRFQLDDPVAKYLPEFATTKVYVSGTGAGMVKREPQRAITIRDLLSHRAGLSYGFFGVHPVDKIYRNAKLFSSGYDLAAFSEEVAKLPLMFDPGERWSYSVATDILGRLIEVVSGQPLDQFFRERIFAPLGMRDTTFRVETSVRPRLATLYIAKDGGFEPSPAVANDGDFGPAVKLLSGGGGLVSTRGDYLRFAQMLLNGGTFGGVRLVSPHTIELMTADVLAGKDIAPAPGFGFGLGFGVLRDLAASGNLGSVGQYGWGGAASTTFWVDPKERLVVVFMTQLLPAAFPATPYPFREQLGTAVYQALIK